MLRSSKKKRTPPLREKSRATKRRDEANKETSEMSKSDSMNEISEDEETRSTNLIRHDDSLNHNNDANENKVTGTETLEELVKEVEEAQVQVARGVMEEKKSNEVGHVTNDGSIYIPVAPPSPKNNPNLPKEESEATDTNSGSSNASTSDSTTTSSSDSSSSPSSTSSNISNGSTKSEESVKNRSKSGAKSHAKDNNSCSKSDKTKIVTPTKNQRSTLFDHGFKKKPHQDETTTEEKLDNDSLASHDSDTTPVRNAKLYMREHGRDSMVRIGVTMVKVEPGTFQQMDKEAMTKEANNSNDTQKDQSLSDQRVQSTTENECDEPEDTISEETNVEEEDTSAKAHYNNDAKEEEVQKTVAILVNENHLNAEQKNLAQCVLEDPTAQIMKQYSKQQRNILSHAQRSQVLIARNATALLAKHLKNKRLNGAVGPVNSDDVLNENPPPDKSNAKDLAKSFLQSTNNCNVGPIK